MDSSLPGYSGAYHAQRPGSFMRLPPELLSAILELVVVAGGHADADHALLHPCDKKAILALSRTCKRFRAAVLPFQYRSIVLSHHKIHERPADPSTAALARTLRDNPFLGSHCQELSIQVSGFYTRQDEATYDAAFGVLREITSVLSNVRTMEMRGNVHMAPCPHLWNLIRSCMANMCSLEYLHLKGSQIVDVNTIQGVHYPSSLRWLHINGLMGFDVLPPRHLDEDTEGPNIEHLVIEGYNIEDGPMSRLLDWPRQLESLVMIQTPACSSKGCSSPAIVRMLQKHKQTLTRLVLKDYRPKGLVHQEGLADLSDFQALEELELCRHQMGGLSSLNMTAMDANRILPPRLKRFTWNFTIHDQLCPKWHYLTPPEVKWLRDLVAAAVERKSPLESIVVCFNPGSSNPEKASYRQWDAAQARGFSRLNAEFAPQGITVTYEVSDVQVDRYGLSFTDLGQGPDPFIDYEMYGGIDEY